MPKELSLFQKRYRKEVAAAMLGIVADDPTFIQRIIAGDETWVIRVWHANKPPIIGMARPNRTETQENGISSGAYFEGDKKECRKKFWFLAVLFTNSQNFSYYLGEHIE